MALLEVQGITKRFGGLVAVNELSLSVDSGQIVALIGPNGAGKTTAFNMISGFYKPDEGKVIFDGKDITALRPDQVCKLGVARTFQVVKPFTNLNVIENVMVGAYNRTSDRKKGQEKSRGDHRVPGNAGYGEQDRWKFTCCQPETIGGR